MLLFFKKEIFIVFLIYYYNKGCFNFKYILCLIYYFWLENEYLL